MALKTRMVCFIMCIIKVIGLLSLSIAECIGEFGKAEAVLSEIPTTTTRQQTRVRHGGFDIRAARADRNTSLPIDRMLELAGEGVIGELVSPVYSFVGLTSQLRLRSEIAPAWAARAKAAGTQGAVLVPV